MEAEPKKKLKRMIYIYEENLDFYNNLENKSEFVNDALQDARITGRIKNVPSNPKVTETKTAPTLPESTPFPSESPDPRIRETQARVAAMDARAKGE